MFLNSKSSSPGKAQLLKPFLIVLSQRTKEISTEIVVSSN